MTPIGPLASMSGAAIIDRTPIRRTNSSEPSAWTNVASAR